MMDNEFLKKLNTLLSKVEYAKRSEAASNAVANHMKYAAHGAMLSELRNAQTIETITERLSNQVREMYGAEPAVQCTKVMAEYIRKEAASTCLTAQEVAQIAVPEVHKLLMRGILPKHAVTVGIQNAGKRIYEAHCEKMTKHFYG